MIPQSTLNKKMLLREHAGNIKKSYVRYFAFMAAMFFYLNVSAQCPANIVTNADPGICSALVNLPVPEPPANCTSLGAEMVAEGNFENGPGMWQDCGNLAEVHTGLTDHVYGGDISSSNHATEIDHGNNPQPGNTRIPHTLCQNINGFTIGETYRLTFRATRRIDNSGWNIPIVPEVGAIVTIGGTTATVTRTNTVFGYTVETITFVANANSLQLTMVPSHPFPPPPYDVTYGLVVDDISVKQVVPCPPVVYNSTHQSGPFPVGTTSVTYTMDNGNGNISTCSFNVMVNDVEMPTINCTGDITVSSTNAGGAVVNYTAPAGSDNCTASVVQTAGLASGATFPVGTTTNTFVITDGSENSASCSFTVTVNVDENCDGYIIYAKYKVKFDEHNYIGGDVGVRKHNGKAEFKKYNVLDPYKVKAKNISVSHPSSVNNKVYSPAYDEPSEVFIPYDGSTHGLSSINVNSNGVVNGNWKNVKVKKGVTATLTGNNFGKIEVEEGACLTFTASAINMTELDVEKGKKGVNYTRVKFINPAVVKVKEEVKIEDDCKINVNGPKVTFYVGNCGEDGKFEIDGENTQFTANIFMPMGKLEVDGKCGRPVIMTGWYYINKLYAGEYIYWNKYNCGSSSRSLVNDVTEHPETDETEPVLADITIVPDSELTITSKDVFSVKAYPNPSASDFSILVNSTSTAPISVKLKDISGQVIKVFSTVAKGSLIKLGNDLRGGIYIAEVTQGANRQIVRLVKLN